MVGNMKFTPIWRIYSDEIFMFLHMSYIMCGIVLLKSSEGNGVGELDHKGWETRELKYIKRGVGQRKAGRKEMERG
jgi:hypothetical protein